MTDHTKPFVERRKDQASPRVLLVEQIDNNVRALRVDLNEGLAAIRTEAFPDGDAQGHREYHLAMMEAAKNRAEFWRKLLFELTKWGLLGFLGWLVTDLVKAHFK